MLNDHDSWLLGNALLAEGVIDEAQLDEARRALERSPNLSLGQVVTLLFGVPAEVIDVINVQRVVLPLVGPALLERLKALICRDRFGRGLDLGGFITEVEAAPSRYETRIVESRSYDHTSPAGMSSSFRRFVETEVEVDAALMSRAGEAVAGRLRVRHPGQDSARLVILDDDDQLSQTIYFDLKAIYLRQALRQEY